MMIHRTTLRQAQGDSRLFGYLLLCQLSLKAQLIPVESEDSPGTFFIAPPFDRLRVTAVFSVIAVSHAELVEACEEDPGKSP